MYMYISFPVLKLDDGVMTHHKQLIPGLFLAVFPWIPDEYYYQPVVSLLLSLVSLVSLEVSTLDGWLSYVSHDLKLGVL